MAFALSGCLEPTPGYLGADSGGTAGTGATSSGSTTLPGDAGSDTTGTTSGTGGSGDGETSSGGATSSGGTGTSGTGSSGTGTGSSGTGTGNTGEHLIFVTSTSYGADFGDPVAADAICQTHADGAGLSGDFVALLSSATVAARDRVMINGTIVNLPGQIIAVDGADLWDGTIQNPVAFDENGNDGPGVTWTGSKPDGGVGATCLDWTSASNTDYGTQGIIRSADAAWFADIDDRCFKVKRFYCISQ